MVDDLSPVPEAREDFRSQIDRELPSGPLAVIAAGADEGDVGRLDARLQQGVHHHREDDLHGACRTGGIVEADRDPHPRLRELLQRRRSVGLLDGLPSRDGGMGQCTRVVELDHVGMLGDRDLERAIAEVDRGALGTHHEPVVRFRPSAVSSAISAGPQRASGITLSPSGHGAIACSAVFGWAMSYRHSSGIRHAPRPPRVVTQEKSSKGTWNAGASNTYPRASCSRHAGTRIQRRSVASAAASVGT